MLLALDGERDRSGTKALHRECEIGETVVPGERFAQYAQCARVDVRGRTAESRWNAVAQQPRRTERRNVAPADRIDVGLDVVVLGCEAVRATNLGFRLQPLQCADRPAIRVRCQCSMLCIEERPLEMGAVHRRAHVLDPVVVASRAAIADFRCPSDSNNTARSSAGISFRSSITHRSCSTAIASNCRLPFGVRRTL